MSPLHRKDREISNSGSKQLDITMKLMACYLTGSWEGFPQTSRSFLHDYMHCMLCNGIIMLCNGIMATVMNLCWSGSWFVRIFGCSQLDFIFHSKFHWLVHVPAHLANLGCLPSCFTHERKHKTVKRFLQALCNTSSYERTGLQEVVAQDLFDLKKDGVFSSQFAWWKCLIFPL